MMKLKIFIFCLLLPFSINNSLASSTYYDESLPKWLEMLKSGNVSEKKLALDNLFFLNYAQYRKDIKVFDPILDALKDKDPSIREAAAACLKRIGEGIQKSVDDKAWSQNCCRNTAIVPSLIKTLEDSSLRVRAEAAKALGMYRYDRKDRDIVDKEERAIDPLIQVLKDTDPWVRLNAAFSLGELKAQNAVDPLIALLEDNPDWRGKFVQQEALRALRKIGIVNSRLISFLIKTAEDEYLRADIIETLATFPTSSAKDVLLKGSSDPNDKIRKYALKALSLMPVMPADQKTNGTNKLAILERSLKDPSVQIRVDAVKNISIYDASLIPPLTAALNDSSNEVKLYAIVALGSINDEQIFDILLSFVETNNDPKLIDKAKGSFRLRAEMQKQKVYIYKKENKRYVVENWKDMAGKGNFTTKISDAILVSKLIKKSNEDPSKFLSLLNFFEDKRIEAVLIKSLDSPSVLAKETALRSLSSYGANNVPKIIELLKDPDPAVRKAAVITLGEIKDTRSLDSIIERLDDSDSWVRTFAMDALSKFDDPRVVELYLELLNSSDRDIRSTAAFKLADKANNRAVEVLISLLNDPYESDPRRAAHALGKIRDRRAVDPLIRALNGEYNRNRMFNGDTELRESAAEALGLLGDNKALPVLTKVALNQKEDDRLRSRSIKAIKAIGGSSRVDIISPYLMNSDIQVKKNAIMLLGWIREKKGIEPLKPFLKDSDADIRKLANDAISNIESTSVHPSMKKASGIPPMAN